MSFGIATDSPEGYSFIHQYEAILLNTRKPIIQSSKIKPTVCAMSSLLTTKMPSMKKTVDLVKKEVMQI
jgi:hypothetical protein